MFIDGVRSDQLPATDRGLAYGDGLFETIRIHRGRPVFLEQHMKRLESGCARLRIGCHLSQWRRWLELALAAGEAGHDAILKLVITRGSGGRGYRPPEPGQPRCLISLHDFPHDTGGHALEGIKAFVCSQRLAHQPVLAGIKHLNRLEQVLASREFPDAGWQEGFMCDYSDMLVEGTRSNIFLSFQGRLLTPGLELCGIEGILRAQLLDVFGSHVSVCPVPLARLEEADEVFICNSVFGIWPVTLLRHAGMDRNLQAGPWAREAQAWFNGVLG